MSDIIGIIDCGPAGNIHSVSKAVSIVGGNVKIIKTQSDFTNVTKLIIPGVGTFSDIMNTFKKDNILESLNFLILEKSTPVLGICLGMQILGEVGFENEKTEGLGLVTATSKKMDCKGVLPNVGFNKIKIIKDCILLDGISENDDFYFMHYFEIENSSDVSATSNYFGYDFISAIGKNNIFGVQFHPEKSREPGIRIFDNFVNKVVAG